MEEQWITTAEAATILGVKKANVIWRVNRGDLFPMREPRRPGEKVYRFIFRRSEIERVRDNWRPMPLRPYTMKPSATDCAYLAGLIDGEGSITIHRKAARIFMLQLAVYNSHEPVLSWIVQTFGCGYTFCRRTPRRPVEAPGYMWRGSALIAQRILEHALPYMIIKREQALLAIEFQTRLSGLDLGLWRRIPDGETEWRLEQKERISRLNRPYAIRHNRHPSDGPDCPESQTPSQGKLPTLTNDH